MMILKSLASFYGRDFPLTKPGFAPIPSPQLMWLKLSRVDRAPGYHELNKLALEDMSEVRPGGRSNSFEYCV